MANNKSAALFRASNCELLDYPYVAAIKSALSLCDEACVVVHEDSQDNTKATLDWLADHYEGRVKIREEYWTWDRMWQERWWDWAAEMTDADWLMYHDADEALLEGDIPYLKGLMDDPDLNLVCFPYQQFYGTPRYIHKKFYRYNTRLGRRSAGFRMRNQYSDEPPHRSPCAMVFGSDERDAHGYRGPGMVFSQVSMYHYGWCRTYEALVTSRLKARDWYADGKQYGDGTLPDPSEASIGFNLAIKLERGVLKRYDGAHPKILREWFTEHEAEWDQRESGL